MATNENPTILHSVHANFEEYELFLGVADSYVQALRIAASYRQMMKAKGWHYSKRGEIGSLSYLESRKDQWGRRGFVTFEIEECQLNKMVL